MSVYILLFDHEIDESNFIPVYLMNMLIHLLIVHVALQRVTLHLEYMFIGRLSFRFLLVIHTVLFSTSIVVGLGRFTRVPLATRSLSLNTAKKKRKLQKCKGGQLCVCTMSYLEQPRKTPFTLQSCFHIFRSWS